MLKDGKWHEADQLRQSMNLTEDEMKEILDFLGKYHFAQVDEKKERLKVDKDFKRILTLTT
jgi:hypothetical protein